MCETAGRKPVAADGQARRSAPRDTRGGGPHRVGAWAAASRPVLAQQAVADGSHDVAAVPERLRVRGREGAVVAIAAAGCRKEMAGPIRDRGGDGRLAVRGDQPMPRAAAHAASAGERG